MQEHPDERRLYEAALHREKLTPDERKHLQHCHDCEELIRTFARQQLNDPRRESKTA